MSISPCYTPVQCGRVWTNHLASVCFTYSICKIEIIMVYATQGCIINEFLIPLRFLEGIYYMLSV